MYCCIGTFNSVFNDVSQYVLGKAILQTFHKKSEKARNKNKKKRKPKLESDSLS
jgi:hypothetical protein